MAATAIASIAAIVIVGFTLLERSIYKPYVRESGVLITVLWIFSPLCKLVYIDVVLRTAISDGS